MSAKIRFANSYIQNVCYEILDLVRQNQGKGFLVGGSVRDGLMGIAAKDIDIEVYGIPLEKLIAIFKERFAINFVGKSFGVIKLNHYPIDVSIPRTETKTGKGYKGFEIQTNHQATVEEACARRDFTINAILLDPLEEKFLDPFGGKKDLSQGILRHTTEKFSEDPLRVLRAMQFLARFEFRIAEESLRLCQTIDIENLSPERIFEEWKKLILKGKKISLGLNFLKESTWLKFFPELQALDGCPQYQKWHPEGDVFVHTGLCMDAFVQERHKCEQQKENLLVGLAVLCHDFGKPATTKIHPDGKITSYRHDVEGIAPTVRFLNRFTNQKEIIKEVSLLVRYHMIPREFYVRKVSDSAILRLANKVGDIKKLIRVCKADSNGKGEDYQESYPAGEWLLEKANRLKIARTRPKPLLMGRHLIAIGLKPSKNFATLLELAYQAQLDKKIHSSEEAITLLKRKQLIE